MILVFEEVDYYKYRVDGNFIGKFFFFLIIINIFFQIIKYYKRVLFITSFYKRTSGYGMISRGDGSLFTSWG